MVNTLFFFVYSSDIYRKKKIMGKYLKKFETQAAYEAAQSGLILPNVSLTVDNNAVHYNPYVSSFFCKLILNNGETVELEGSGELTSVMISPYISTCVSAEIGTLCTSFGYGAFQYCSSLTSIDIPSSVTSIGESVFLGCSLTSIDIPDSVTSISQYAFQQCSNLTSCTIGSGVTSIASSAFEYCTSLTSITSNAPTAPTIRPYTFHGVKTGGTLTVPIGSTGYDVWMGTSDYYLGSYDWTKVEH